MRGDERILVLLLLLLLLLLHPRGRSLRHARERTLQGKAALQQSVEHWVAEEEPCVGRPLHREVRALCSPQRTRVRVRVRV